MIPLNPFTARSEAANFTLQAPFAGLAGSSHVRSIVRFQRGAAPPISATVLTKNSERLLGEVLTSLAWCDEVVVLDTGSTDRTVTIAVAYPNVSLHHLAGSFPGFGRAHQQAVELARNDWILSVDSDEVISGELALEISALPLDPESVYTISFQNYFNGKRITTCGWAPDRHERLFNRAVTNFCASEVHERVQTHGQVITSLRHPIRHYSYESLEDFLRKMSSYSRLFAAQNAGKKRSGPCKAVTRSVWAFFKSYLLQLGILQGYEGLAISACKAQTVFWKYLMLYEANRRSAA
ncbi:MAG: glycosyltransferase family 2 protein [Opitutaceae bacterium]